MVYETTQCCLLRVKIPFNSLYDLFPYIQGTILFTNKENSKNFLQKFAKHIVHIKLTAYISPLWRGEEK